ncbi:secreted protein [Moniliophthora roreri MCA 2997]|uniref:Secreted protein n=2 Tax=Moniliophthora roreri TaxID=221103 RepID=V2XDB9_MONRO|nr:secreted protein [Moniliophthora roreri MCA 2997]
MHLEKLFFSTSWLTLAGTAIAGLAMFWPVPLERMDVGASMSVDYYSPLANGGSMLIDAGWGFGEPLNVIISGLSSAQVLTDEGFVNYARAIGFSKECLGIHLGDPMPANLGDGNGWVNQTIELRQHYGNIVFGTCWESLVGGNHFRMYRQNGSQAPSGALFLAVSKEENVTAHHMIVADGYNIGRDDLGIRAAGTTSFLGVKYRTVARNVSGLLAPGSKGVNHGIATDGITTVLTVTIV